MNILFLSETFYPAFAKGAELATHQYAKSLAKEGQSVIVVTNRFKNEPHVSIEDGFTIRRLHMFDSLGTQYKYKVLSRIDRLLSGYLASLIKWSDVVYIPRYWYSAIPLAKAYGKPVVVHLHDYIAVCPLACNYDVSRNTICRRTSCTPRCVYTYERMAGQSVIGSLRSTVANVTVGPLLIGLLELSDAIICVSNAQRNIIVEKRPTIESRATVILNPNPPAAHVPMNGDDFGYFGGRLYFKGFNTLRRALAVLDRDGRKVTVQAYRTRLLSDDQTLSQTPGLIQRGDLPVRELNQAYERIRSIIVPSLLPEPLPYVVAEGLVRGRFVIASNVGGIPEQVEGCKGALLVQPDDHEQLAEAIDRVSGMCREEILDLGLQNREAFLKKFDGHRAVEQFIGVCERVS